MDPHSHRDAPLRRQPPPAAHPSQTAGTDPGKRAGGQPASLQAARPPSWCSQRALPANPARGAPQETSGGRTGAPLRVTHKVVAPQPGASLGSGFPVWKTPSSPFNAPKMPPPLYFTPPRAPPSPWGAADAGRALLDPQSALAVAAGVTQSQAWSRESFEPGSVPRTPRAQDQRWVPPPDHKQPALCAWPGREQQLDFKWKTSTKIMNGHHPVSLRLSDPSVASLATSSPQQQVLVAPGLSPGQAGMSPQRLG